MTRLRTITIIETKRLAADLNYSPSPFIGLKGPAVYKAPPCQSFGFKECCSFLKEFCIFFFWYRLCFILPYLILNLVPNLKLADKVSAWFHLRALCPDFDQNTGKILVLLAHQIGYNNCCRAARYPAHSGSERYQRFLVVFHCYQSSDSAAAVPRASGQ